MSIIDKLFGAKETSTELKISSIDSLSFVDSKFSDVFMANMYTKIMHEAADRASLPEGVEKDAYSLTMYDSYSPAKRGLISIVVKNMIENTHKYYRKEITGRGDFIFIEVSDGSYLDDSGNLTDPDILELDFTDFYESKVLSLLFALLKNVLQSMSNGVTISQSLIIQIHELSQMIDNNQNTKPLIDQLTQMNDSITQGNPGVIDAKSKVTFMEYKSEAAKNTVGFIFGLIAGITGAPTSYLFSDVVGGLGDMSKSEEKRLDMAIKRYFHSILSGSLYATFDKVFQYKNLISDVDGSISLFTWLETTTSITPEAKAKLIVDNTVLNHSDINLAGLNINPLPTLPKTPTAATGSINNPGDDA